MSANDRCQEALDALDAGAPLPEAETRAAVREWLEDGVDGVSFPPHALVAAIRDEPADMWREDGSLILPDLRDMIRQLITDLDTARATGVIFTYGAVQQRLRDALSYTVPTSAPEPVNPSREDVERLLAHHWPSDAVTCYDHEPTSSRPCWCCKCGAHNLTIGWIAHVAADLDALLLGRSEAVVKAEALREFADTRGVNVGDEDSYWWDGYRQAQRECLHDALTRAARIEREGSWPTR